MPPPAPLWVDVVFDFLSLVRDFCAGDATFQCSVDRDAGSGEALIPVIGQLTDLVRRIEEQQKAEEEHKEWSARAAVVVQTPLAHRSAPEEISGLKTGVTVVTRLSNI